MNPNTSDGNARRLVRLGVIAGLLVAFSFWLGIQVGYTNSRQVAALSILSGYKALPPEDVDFSPLWEALEVLRDKFVPATSTALVGGEDIVWGAIQGATSAYGDPYTVFFPPAESTAFEEDISGSFGGVGIEIGMQNDRLIVIAPLKGTPADRAGIKSGDKIVEIDGESTDRISIDEAVQKIRGTIGTMVRLTVAREGESQLRTIPVRRANIEIPTIDTELRSDGVFLLRLYNFTAPSPNLFRDALREFADSGSNKLILDLRNNPGGFLEAAIDMASWFLPSGKVIVTENFGSNKEPNIHRSKGYNIFTDQLKMVILINEGSASASEILAGALREHGVATLVGKSTFGKGSVQELIKITPDTSLKVTVARWLTPEGNSISDGGLKPDVEVDITEENIIAGEDPQLDRAVELLLK